MDIKKIGFRGLFIFDEENEDFLRLTQKGKKKYRDAFNGVGVNVDDITSKTYFLECHRKALQLRAESFETVLEAFNRRV